MARTLKSDSSSGLFHFGNGSSVINPAFPLLDMGKFSRTSDFAINPPNVKIDADLSKIVMGESERLRFKTLSRLVDESDWELNKILKDADGTKDGAKARLTKDGKSAVVSEVSKAINASSIDYTSKFLLSNEPLYVYALSYVIYHEGVDDAEGINDRIIVATENKIKTYFNKLLAKKVITDRHLDLSKDQKKQILQAAAGTNISYLQGEPSKAINKIIAKYVDYGDLNMLVDKFFESGVIDPEKGTQQVRQLMVRYLLDIGVMLPKSELNPSAPGGVRGTGPSGGSVPAGSAEPKATRKSEPGAASSGEKGREAGVGIPTTSSESPISKDSASELAKRISEMDIAPRKESTNPGVSPGSAKTKSGK